MNNTNHESMGDLLDRATAALRNAPVSNAPPQRLAAATVGALHSRIASIDRTVAGGVEPEITRSDNQWKQGKFRIEHYGALAAVVVLLIMTASFAMWLDRSATTAFAQVIKNVKEAKSVIFTARLSISTPESNKTPWLEYKTYLQGDLMRTESSLDQSNFEGSNQSSESISIGDWRTKQVLLMNQRAKTASWPDIDKVTKQFINPIEAISTLADKDGEFVGEEELNGRKTRVFKLLRINFLTGGQAADLKQREAGKVWIDAENELPVKITAETFSGFDHKKLSAIFDGFIWNQPLDPQLFKLEIPEGFKVIEGNGQSEAGYSSTTVIPFLFSLVVENVKQASSVTFTAKEYLGPYSAGHPLLVIFYLQGDLMRSEIPGDQATIVTWPPGPDGQRSILAPGKPIFVLDILDRKSLDVMEINFGVNSAAKYKTNPRALQNWFILPEALASIADKEPKLIGKETINGRQTLIYRLGKSFWPGGGVIAEDETAKAWVDAETRLPVRLLLVTNSNGRIAGEPDRRWKDTIDLVDFVWNKPLNPELFKPEIPQGFKVSDKMPGAPEPAK